MKPLEGAMAVQQNDLTKYQINKLTALIDKKIEAQRSLDAARSEFDDAGVALINFIYSLEAK